MVIRLLMPPRRWKARMSPRCNGAVTQANSGPFSEKRADYMFWRGFLGDAPALRRRACGEDERSCQNLCNAPRISLEKTQPRKGPHVAGRPDVRSRHPLGKRPRCLEKRTKPSLLRSPFAALAPPFCSVDPIHTIEDNQLPVHATMDEIQYVFSRRQGTMGRPTQQQNVPWHNQPGDISVLPLNR